MKSDRAAPSGRRPTLIARSLLQSARPDEPVITVLAPPGYGKTTLLAQWARQLRRVAWVSCERSDNNPVALLSRLLGALDRTEPASAQATALLAASAAGVDVVPRLVAPLSAAHAEALPNSPRLGSCSGHGDCQRLPC